MTWVPTRIENVQFFRKRIEIIEDFPVSHSIQQIWLIFPDPHLNTRHKPPGPNEACNKGTFYSNDTIEMGPCWFPVGINAVVRYCLISPDELGTLISFSLYNLSMIIIVTDNIGVANDKSKKNTPITCYFYGMEALFVTAPLMKKRPWIINILYFTRSI